MKEKIKQALIENNSNPLIFDTFTDFLVSLQGKDFKEFKYQIENYFWEIQNYCHIITDPELANGYTEKNEQDFLENRGFNWIKEFWSVQNVGDLTSLQIANYMLSAIEQDKINKINEILFNLINQEEDKTNKFNEILFNLIN